MTKKNTAWIIWSVTTLVVLVYYLAVLYSDDKTEFTPGEMTHGHYQIEMACADCHADAFGGGEVLQDACVNCHGAELKEVDDSHPKSKFTDPRNASRVKDLDARVCVTCHTEHRQEITAEMGVTLPEDFCFKCHVDIAEDRPSHKGMAFNTCASAGCHNYHDNSALYEDFLEKHRDEKINLDRQQLSEKSAASELTQLSSYPIDLYPLKNLTVKEIDVDGSHVDSNIDYNWEKTAHAKAGVNCSACHQIKSDKNDSSWTDKPGEEVCKTCHSGQVEGFLDGKHGMRLKSGLSSMTPADARLPMRPNAHNRELSCVSCHSAHKFDVQQAQVESCLGCHVDEHSQAYKKSPHFKLLYNEINGQAEKNTGVSCATCHLPRTQLKEDGKVIVQTEHNQNLNLRPNEKMLRSVCMNCHGLGFSIDALADKKLIKNNFSGKPSIHIESIDMVNKRIKNRKPREGSE